jgi:hypothetical protein
VNGRLMSPWTRELPNPWRVRACGHMVVSLPIWLYCDDTSGNRSKKWNEHNSFLFTLAGLPQEEASQEYNIHFLCTSNLARPLEMLEGVVEDIRFVHAPSSNEIRPHSASEQSTVEASGPMTVCSRNLYLRAGVAWGQSHAIGICLSYWFAGKLVLSDMQGGMRFGNYCHAPPCHCALRER